MCHSGTCPYENPQGDCKAPRGFRDCWAEKWSDEERARLGRYAYNILNETMDGVYRSPSLARLTATSSAFNTFLQTQDDRSNKTMHLTPSHRRNNNNSVEIRVGMYDHSSGTEKCLGEYSRVTQGSVELPTKHGERRQFAIVTSTLKGIFPEGTKMGNTGRPQDGEGLLCGITGGLPTLDGMNKNAPHVRISLLRPCLPPKFKVGQWVIHTPTGGTPCVRKVLGTGSTVDHVKSVDTNGHRGNLRVADCVPLEGNEHLVLKKYDRVLVRDGESHSWFIGLFTSWDAGVSFPFYTNDEGNCYRYAIPFEPFQHLIGTNKNPYALEDTTDNNNNNDY